MVSSDDKHMNIKTSLFGAIVVLVIMVISISLCLWIAIDESSLVNFITGRTKPPPGYTILSNGKVFTYRSVTNNFRQQSVFRFDCKHKAIRMAWFDFDEVEISNDNWKEIK